MIALLAAVACAGSPLDSEIPQAAAPIAAGQAEAEFAMGCFWCGESDMEKVPGVITVESGYAGGKSEHPTYHQVGSGGTGHAEAVRVVYDPSKVTYEKLLDWFWHHVDPTDGGGQFCDRGSQYRPAIFPVDDAQRKAAEASKAAVATELGKPIAVGIETPGTFWVAEGYHQDFYKTNPTHYQQYRAGCGRDRRVQEVWGAAAAHP
jgi:methionine-S-sulfoxide reductase